jgi:MFS family permease
MSSRVPNDGLWSPGRRGLTIGLVLTITLVAFEALAVSTVMPIVARELGGYELYGWVFTAFMLGSLIGIVVSGGIIDKRGLGAPFLLGVGLFAIGLLGGGLAPSMPILVLFRFIQGLGGGMVPPIAYVAIGRSLPERLRPQMFATLSTAWVLPGVIGPAIAGAVGEHLHWRYVFLGLLPLILVAATISYPSLRRITATPTDAAEDAERTAAASLRRRLPLAIMVAGGTGLFLAGLTSGRLELLVPLVAIGAGLGLVAFRRLTPPGTLRAARGVPAAVLMRGVLTFTFFGVDAYVALALVEWRGLTATEAGIALTAATLTWTAGSWIQARLASRYPTERFVQVGLAVVIAGLAAFAVVLSPAVPPWLAIPTFGLAGLGMGLAYAPITLIVLRETPPAEQGSASAAVSLSDSLGTALGTGVTGAIVAASVRATGAPVDGLAIGFAFCVAVGFAGLALSTRLRLPRRSPAAAVALADTSRVNAS